MQHHFHVCITTKNACPKWNREETQDELWSRVTCRRKGLYSWNLSKIWKGKSEEIWKESEKRWQLNRHIHLNMKTGLEGKRSEAAGETWLGSKDLEGRVIRVTSWLGRRMSLIFQTHARMFKNDDEMSCLKLAFKGLEKD